MFALCLMASEMSSLCRRMISMAVLSLVATEEENKKYVKTQHEKLNMQGEPKRSFA